jgi:hypothetical protein
MHKFKITLLFLLLFDFHSSFSKDLKIDNRASIQDTLSRVLETLFKPATNSPEFNIVKTKDLLSFKSFIIENEKTQNGLILSLENQIMVKNDSIKLVVKELDKLALENQELLSPKKKDELWGLDIYKVILPSLLFLLVLLLIYLAIYYLKLYTELKSSKESIVSVEKELETYKRNSVERERKLMRQLLDLQKKLEE